MATCILFYHAKQMNARRAARIYSFVIISNTETYLKETEFKAVRATWRPCAPRNGTGPLRFGWLTKGCGNCKK